MKKRYLIPLCLLALVLAAAGGAVAAVQMMQVQKVPVQAVYDPQDGFFSKVSVFDIVVHGHVVPCVRGSARYNDYGTGGLTCDFAGATLKR